LYCRGESGRGVTVIGARDKEEHLTKVMITIVTKKSTNTVTTVVGRVMTVTINFVTRKNMIMTAQSQGSSL